MRFSPFDDPQDAAPVFHCERCDGELYDYDNCFLCGGMILCEACADEYDEEYDWMAPAYAVQDYYRRIYGGNEF